MLTQKGLCLTDKTLNTVIQQTQNFNLYELTFQSNKFYSQFVSNSLITKSISFIKNYNSEIDRCITIKGSYFDNLRKKQLLKSEFDNRIQNSKKN